MCEKDSCSMTLPEYLGSEEFKKAVNDLIEELRIEYIKRLGRFYITTVILSRKEMTDENT